MPVTITINGEDAGHTLRELHGLAAGMSQTTAVPRTAVTTGVTGNVVAETKTENSKPLTPAQKKKAVAAISTGEERVGPEDSPVEQAQDAADEAAEKGETKDLSHDDIRAALGDYVAKFGMPAAQEDGPKVIKLAMDKLKVAKPGDAKSAWKVSEIPGEQPALRSVFDGIVEMTDKNPFERKVVAEKAA